MENYRKIRVVGKGSFGCAIQVQNQQTRKYYIMKVIDVSRMDKKQKSDALNEVTFLKQLNHPFIITYRESFMDKNRYLCIVMDYAEGGDLYQMIKKTKKAGQTFEEDLVLEWFIQICFALKFIHSKRILHRDLKTQNIFLTTSNEAKIGDFGIARILQNTSDCAQTAIGTPYYLSPEICQEKPYNQKSDIWSLGCILYELLTLKHAFDAQSLVLKILRGQYPPIPEKYSDDLKVLIQEMLSKNPEDRPSIKKILQKPFLQKRIQIYMENQSKQNLINEVSAQKTINDMNFLKEQNIEDNDIDDKLLEQQNFNNDSTRKIQQLTQAPINKKTDIRRSYNQEFIDHIKAPQLRLNLNKNGPMVSTPISLSTKQVLQKIYIPTLKPKHPPINLQNFKKDQSQKSINANQMNLQTKINFQYKDEENINTLSYSNDGVKTKITPQHFSQFNLQKQINTQIQKNISIQQIYQNQLLKKQLVDTTENQKLHDISNTQATRKTLQINHKSHNISISNTDRPNINISALLNNLQPQTKTKDLQRPRTNTSHKHSQSIQQFQENLKKTKSRRSKNFSVDLCSKQSQQQENEDNSDDNFEEAEDQRVFESFLTVDGQSLPGVNDKDSFFLRVEALRCYLEKQLGQDLFLQAYKILNDEDSQLELKEILNDNNQKYIPLIFQLIVCEDSYFVN